QRQDYLHVLVKSSKGSIMKSWRKLVQHKVSRKAPGEEHPHRKPEQPDTFDRVFNIDRGSKGSGSDSGSAGTRRRRGRGHKSESEGILGESQAAKRNSSGGLRSAVGARSRDQALVGPSAEFAGAAGTGRARG
ncbi:unnamed protein product, partial [Ascophyllum nodosum]